MERCRPAPSDQAGPVKSIEVAFAIPVNITRAQEKRLHELLDDIVSHPSNQLVDGVHWVSAHGGKILWREPEEPDIDMDILAIETSARPFVSDRERDRTLKEREENRK